MSEEIEIVLVEDKSGSESDPRSSVDQLNAAAKAAQELAHQMRQAAEATRATGQPRSGSARTGATSTMGPHLPTTGDISWMNQRREAEQKKAADEISRSLAREQKKQADEQKKAADETSRSLAREQKKQEAEQRKAADEISRILAREKKRQADAADAEAKRQGQEVAKANERRRKEDAAEQKKRANAAEEWARQQQKQEKDQARRADTEAKRLADDLEKDIAREKKQAAEYGKNFVKKQKKKAADQEKARKEAEAEEEKATRDAERSLRSQARQGRINFRRGIDAAHRVAGMVGGIGGALISGGASIAEAMHAAQQAAAAAGGPGGGAPGTPGTGGGGAAGAAGAAAGASGAMGTVGVALAVVGAMLALRQAAKNAADSLGDFTASLVSPDTDPSNFVGAFGKNLSDSNVLTAMTMHANVLVGKSFETFAKVMRNLDAMAERYSSFSPQLAGSMARADVAQILGDFRRAQVLAPQLSGFVDARSQLQQKIEDAKMRFMIAMLPLVTRGIDLLSSGMDLVNGGLDKTLDIMAEMPVIGEEIKKARKALDDMASSMTGEEDAGTAAILAHYLEPGQQEGYGRAGVRTRFDPFTGR